MPPKCKFSKDEIVNATLALVRESGFDSVTARSVAASLSASPKVIFSLFPDMSALKSAAIAKAYEEYREFMKERISKSSYPLYKASGMAYISFAKEERELFKLLFMRDRTEDRVGLSLDSDLLDLIVKSTGYSRERAEKFHLRMWVFVHGLAVMVATKFLEWDLAEMSEMVSDCYIGLKKNEDSRNEHTEG